MVGLKLQPTARAVLRATGMLLKKEKAEKEPGQLCQPLACDAALDNQLVRKQNLFP